jgi:hypothetical protein
MDEFRAQHGWTDELDEEHRFQWALRTLTCRHARCRRHERCQRPFDCPALLANPVPEPMGNILFKIHQAQLARRLEEIQSGRPPDLAGCEARAREAARRDRRASRRAREALGLRRR